MMTSKRYLRHLATAGITLLVTTGLALAGAHTWTVNEVFSNSCGSIQFIELKECCGGNFEQGAPGHNVTSNTNSYLMPGGALPPNTANKTLLYATPACAALPGFPTPDGVIPAGSVPFFSVNGDSVSYFPYNTLTFGPGVCPTDGIHSLGPSLVVGVNSPKNYAGTTISIDVSCALKGDVNNNGVRDGDDVAAFVRAKLGTPNAGDNVFCADYCTGNLDGDVAAFVNDLLS